MIVFVDDDAEYQAWLERYPAGFVVNAERKPSPAYLILHRATCGTISGTPARGERWTVDYIKVCANTQAELGAWARNELHASLKPCQLCSPPG